VMDGVERFLSGAIVLQIVAMIVKIARDVVFKPVTFIGKGWKMLDKETDERAVKLAEVDFTKVNLATCLKEGEPSITGEEKLKRLREGGDILLDVGIFLALWNEEGHTTLNWLYKERGVTYLDFFGTILEGPSGGRYVLYLYRRDDGRWDWHCDCLAHDWNGENFSASLASLPAAGR